MSGPLPAGRRLAEYGRRLAARPLEIEVRPPWPYRLPLGSGGDGIARARGGVVVRLLHCRDVPVAVAAWQRRGGEVRLRAAAPPGVEARPEALETAVRRMRFAFAVDDDLAEFREAMRGDPLVGPAIAARPWHRPRRRPVAWEALAWAVTKQLIDSPRAAAIQRRLVRRWGAVATSPFAGRRPIRDVPAAAAIAARAPAELAALDLAPSRALALIAAAREVARGRVDPADPAADARLRAIRGIGPWTLQCLGLHGRGEPDALPAGDLAYLKLVGRLAGLGRRATVEEVEAFFASYAPFRGLAGSFVLAHYHRLVAHGPLLRLAA
jgi:3-methyladenine DNA glycosylase/8-oxoguanine DNA glycosylase